MEVARLDAGISLLTLIPINFDVQYREACEMIRDGLVANLQTKKRHRRHIQVLACCKPAKGVHRKVGGKGGECSQERKDDWRSPSNFVRTES